MRRALFIFALIICATSALAQTQIQGFAADPVTCDPSRGLMYYNTVTQFFKICTAVNTWSNLGGGGGGSPGGTPFQIQFNNSGAFGGILGSSVTAGTGAITFTAGADTTNPLTLNSHSSTQSVPLTDVSNQGGSAADAVFNVHGLGLGAFTPGAGKGLVHIQNDNSAFGLVVSNRTRDVADGGVVELVEIKVAPTPGTTNAEICGGGNSGIYSCFEYDQPSSPINTALTGVNTTTPFGVEGASGQNRDIFEILSSTLSVLSGFDSNGLPFMNGTTSGTAKIGVAAVAGSPCIFQLPTANPSANQFLESAAPSGSPSACQTSWTSSLTAASASTTPLTLIAAASQTANIFQVQNNTPATISGFGPTGGVFTGANDATAYNFLAKSSINSINDSGDPDDVLSLVGSTNEVNLGMFLTAKVDRPVALQMLRVGTNGGQFNTFVKPDGGSIFDATHVLPTPPYYVVDSPTNDATVYDTTSAMEISGGAGQNDALTLVGGSAGNAVNLNFYLRAITARKGAIQVNTSGTNGGGMSIYVKADGGGLTQVNAWNSLLETKFTPTIAAGTQNVSGCSLTSALGGSWTGSFHSGTAGTCTVTITPGGTATNGWQCDATDITTAADTVKQTTPLSTTTCVISGTTASGDIITWKATAF